MVKPFKIDVACISIATKKIVLVSLMSMMYTVYHNNYYVVMRNTALINI